MKIKYGIVDKYIDVTDICLSKLNSNNVITIPSNDVVLASFFSDPLIGIKKLIFVITKNKTSSYDDRFEIIINLKKKSISSINKFEVDNKINEISVINKINDKIKIFHSKLKLKYGNMSDELPEQKMVVRYLTGKEKVLEIGGNIGRNSLIISSILKNSNNLVTLESSKEISKQLQENKDLNNFNFHIENSALSKRKLIQTGWETIPSDTLLEGYEWVNTVTYSDLKTKYNIEFDTLVLDCEGAFYYILMDMPEILDNINLIIMENDYNDINKKIYIDKILTEKKFTRDYVEAGGWEPCFNNFFEVWKK